MVEGCDVGDEALKYESISCGAYRSRLTGVRAASGRQLSGFKLGEEMRHWGALCISSNDRIKVRERGEGIQTLPITAERNACSTGMVIIYK